MSEFFLYKELKTRFSRVPLFNVEFPYFPLKDPLLTGGDGRLQSLFQGPGARCRVPGGAQEVPSGAPRTPFGVLRSLDSRAANSQRLSCSARRAEKKKTKNRRKIMIIL